MIIISPSLLAADISVLSDEVERVSAAEWLHVDVMDGHFVPNLSYGIPLVSALKRISNRFLDVHLMIDNPDAFIEPFAKAGADLICIHAEVAMGRIPQLVEKIKSYNCMAGIALKPSTGIECVLPYLDILDMVLVMTVEPGFGGQVFMADMLPKIKLLRGAADNRRIPLHIQVDGGIDERTGAECVHAGADVLVAGSYIFGAENSAEAIATLCSITAQQCSTIGVV